jgi:hypothetical protein
MLTSYDPDFSPDDSGREPEPHPLASAIADQFALAISMLREAVLVGAIRPVSPALTGEHVLTREDGAKIGVRFSVTWPLGPDEISNFQLYTGEEIRALSGLDDLPE